MIPIYKPYISKYKSSAIAAINDEWISNYGINIDLATNKINDILKTKYFKPFLYPSSSSSAPACSLQLDVQPCAQAHLS